ncbi:MAG: hypothetical protein M1404_06150 [Acidobacteria bacterium]|nr:hypothetical protein [Acidobacteriota bacterium]
MQVKKFDEEYICQNDDLAGRYKNYPTVLVWAARARDHFAQHGFFQSIGWAVSRLYWWTLVLVGVAKRAPGKTPEIVDEVLNLVPGELVEVKTVDEILATLDSSGRNRGLGFPPEMREYCGRQMRVMRRVQKICLESKPGILRKLKNTVLLEGSVCQGGGIGCDRACPLFWRECWLKRVEPG